MKIGEVSREFLPIKAHYFFFFAALGPLLPQMNVFGRQLGVSPVAMGTVTSILPVLWALAKPGFGFIVDYFTTKRKAIFMSLIMLMSGSYCCLYFLPEPPLDAMRSTGPLLLDYQITGNISVMPIHNLCNLNHKGCNVDTEENFLIGSCGWICKENLQQHQNDVVHNFIFRKKDISKSANLTMLFYNSNTPLKCVNLGMKDVSLPIEHVLNKNKIRSALDTTNATSVFHDDIIERHNKTTCSSHCSQLSCAFNFNDTADVLDLNKNHSLYGSITFWGFVIFMCIGTVAFNVANCISDAVCFDVLGPRRSMRYGWQRAFGTVGYGLTALVSGWAVDWYSSNPLRKDFTPAFILTIGFTLADLFFCRKLQLPTMSRPEKAGAALGDLLCQWSVIAFLFFAVIAGMFDSFIIYYMFWFIEELATSLNCMDNIKLLEGLTVAAESFGGELLFFAISGKILKKFGFGHSLTFCLVCYAVRLFLISLITHPWQILIIEVVMQGPTYALCYATIVGYAAAVAPPGLSATLQGIVAGMDDGLGFALGSLLGGMLYQNVGGRVAFRLFAAIAALAAVAHAILRVTVLKHVIIQVENTQEAEEPPEEEVKFDMQEQPPVGTQLFKGDGDCISHATS